MADPVTLAMVGAAAGAVTNKKDPLKGALLGATLGGVGGALAPGLFGAGATQAAAGAAGAAGVQSGFGAQLASQGLLSAAPAMSSAASPVASTLAAQGLTSAPAAMSTAAAPASAMSGFLSKATSTPVLMAGAQLAGAMTPQQAQTAPIQPSQAKPVNIAFQPVPISQRVVGPLEFMRQDEERQLGAFDVPGLLFERMMPGYSVGEYRPARRM